mmetsp:Transcript_21819/g.60557  ORF Transcript_21819/g.60557 Transcript_21819/m.60557 type:complete len:208 (+) Transcript_21819:108-731(+)
MKVRSCLNGEVGDSSSKRTSSRGFVVDGVLVRQKRRSQSARSGSVFSRPLAPSPTPASSALPSTKTVSDGGLGMVREGRAGTNGSSPFTKVYTAPKPAVSRLPLRSRTKSARLVASTEKPSNCMPTDIMMAKVPEMVSAIKSSAATTKYGSPALANAQTDRSPFCCSPRLLARSCALLVARPTAAPPGAGSCGAAALGPAQLLSPTI